jgi:hypothetical protein
VFFFFETKLAHAAETRDPFWLAYLGAWLQSAACSRIAHIKRSYPICGFRVGRRSFWQGKPRRNRQGLYWGVATTTTEGFRWVGPFMEACKALPI